MVQELAVKSVKGMGRVLPLLVAIGVGGGLLAPAVASANTLYAANTTQGTVSTFSIAADGTLTQIGTGVTSGSSTSSRPYAVAVSPNGQHLYAANFAAGTVSTFSIATDGTLTQIGTGVTSGSSTSSGPYAVAVSPSGQDLYVANSSQGTVSTFSIAADGTLTQIGTGALSGSNAASGPKTVAVSPDGQHVYVGNFAAGTVSTFSIGAGGALTQLGTGVTSGSGTSSGPQSVAVSPNGQDLYAANFNQGTVSTFSIGAGGALTQQGTPATTDAGPQSVVVTPNGQNVYVANNTLGTVSTYTVGAGGALTKQGGSVITDPPGNHGNGGPWGLAVSPNGQNVYVANNILGKVAPFSVGATGALLLQQGSGLTSGSSASSAPQGIVVSPDQGPTAAYSATPASAGSASSFSAATSTAGSAPIATYAWNFGDGATATGPSASHTYANPGNFTVTLTLTGADSCSLFGPFTGQTGYCTSDPAASTSQTITIPPVPPSVPPAIPATPAAKRIAVGSFTALFGTRMSSPSGARKLVAVNGFEGAKIGETITIRCVVHCAHALRIVVHIRKLSDMHKKIDLPRALTLSPGTRIEVDVSESGLVSRFVRYGFVRAGRYTHAHTDATGCLGAGNLAAACP